MARNRFYFYFKWRKYLEKLRPEDALKMVLAVMDFAERGELPDFFGNGSALDMAFADPFETIQRDAEQYLKTCEKNKRNISYRWNANIPDDTTGIKSYQSLPLNTDIDLELDKDSDIRVEEKEKEKEVETESEVESAEEKEGLGEKETAVVSLSPADEFLLKHKDDPNADFVMMCYNIKKDREQARLANISC